MKKHSTRIAESRVEIPSGFESYNLLGERWPASAVVEYIRIFTGINQLKPCPMIIDSRRVEA